MGRGPTNENTNMYFQARKKAATYNERLWSREGAAELLGISVSTLADYELGNTKVVPVDKVVLMVYGDAAPEEIRKPWPVPVVFRNGYSKDSPEVVCKCTLQFGKGKPEWGAEPGKIYYVLKIEEVSAWQN